jgi:hypothetical protein
MNRFITNPQDYTLQDLRSYDWDIVKLNITFDVEPMIEWFEELKTKHLDSLFLFNMKHLFKPYILEDPRIEGIDVGGKSGYWSLQWPVQRTDPLPGPLFCNNNLYPELLEDGWESKMNNHLTHYYYGAYKSFVEQLGQDAWTWGRAMCAGNEVGIGPHRDHDDPGYMIRLHVNLQTDSKSTWHFGTQLGETPLKTWPYMNREYHPKPGEIFLINVSNVHAPINHGDVEWKLLHSDPTNDAIERLLKSSYHISLK